MNALVNVLNGMVVMGHLVVALVFLKYWTRSRDRLFLWFATAFLLLAVIPATQSLLRIPDEHRVYLYLVRLLAFLLIIWAIVDKNRDTRPRS